MTLQNYVPHAHPNFRIPHNTKNQISSPKRPFDRLGHLTFRTISVRFTTGYRYVPSAHFPRSRQVNVMVASLSRVITLLGNSLAFAVHRPNPGKCGEAERSMAKDREAAVVVEVVFVCTPRANHEKVGGLTMKSLHADDFVSCLNVASASLRVCRSCIA